MTKNERILKEIKELAQQFDGKQGALVVLGTPSTDEIAVTGEGDTLLFWSGSLVLESVLVERAEEQLAQERRRTLPIPWDLVKKLMKGELENKNND